MFSGLILFKFGYPNNEAISGHRYYKLGLKPFCFYEVINSEWIAEIEEKNRVHAYHSKALFEKYRHYIFPFHDSTIEVIAKSYEFINS